MVEVLHSYLGASKYLEPALLRFASAMFKGLEILLA